MPAPYRPYPPIALIRQKITTYVTMEVMPVHRYDTTAIPQLIEAFCVKHPTPGLAYGIVRDGELIDAGGTGVHQLSDGAAVIPHADSVFRIASMTKSFTAAAILILRDAGELSLNDPIAAYIDEAGDIGLPTTDCTSITIRQLLTMTSGLPEDNPWGDRMEGASESEIHLFLKNSLRFAWPNNTHYEYSNTGYMLLGKVIESVTGATYREALTSLLIEPLQLSHTVFSAQDVPAELLALGYQADPDSPTMNPAWQCVPFSEYGCYTPMGGLFSSVRDLSRWIHGFTDAFPARDAQTSTDDHPLRRATRREIQQPHRSYHPDVLWPSLSRPPVIRGAGYGFGVDVSIDARHGHFVRHSGGYPGFGSHMRWHPDSGTGVIVLANATYWPAGKLAALIHDHLLTDIPTASAWRATARPANATTDQAPRSGAVWPETLQARGNIERLISTWDDELAAEIFADNVDADEGLAHRRDRLAKLTAQLGGDLVPDPQSEVLAPTPAQLIWWLHAPGGRVRVEISLTPHHHPKIQFFGLRVVAHPAKHAHETAMAVTRAINTDNLTNLPQDIRISSVANETHIVTLLRLAALWGGHCQLGEVVSNENDAVTYQLHGERCGFLLTVTTSALEEETVTAINISYDSQG